MFQKRVYYTVMFSICDVPCSFFLFIKLCVLLVLSTQYTLENSETFNALCDINPEVLLQVLKEENGL